MEREPIAIIGIGCRFPGAANPEQFWQLLAAGQDAIVPVPEARWNVEDCRIPSSVPPMRQGGFLQNIDQFDPQFFNITPDEVVSMDPQQRLLLEVMWEALEDAGQLPKNLAGTQTGIFIGASSSDYHQLLIENPGNIDAHTVIGTLNSVAANRLSYWLDVQGPSITVDTACSSSLVAVHLACQSLWNGESSLAIAGGVHLILSPWVALTLSEAGMLSPSGRCKTFDETADGFVRGEGAGAVILKSLSQAQADGDSIYAVVRGSAVNHDGKGNGLAAINPRAQESLVRSACQQAGISPSTLNYVEVQGPCSKLGDAMEVNAIAAAVSADRTIEAPCLFGSVKTNIGHLEAAAGIASFIKVILSVHHRKVPPTLNIDQPNSYIKFDKFAIQLAKDLTKFPSIVRPNRAGVNAFGLGGTNAHVILEEFSSVSAPVDQSDRAVHLLTLSAKSDGALKDLAIQYEKFIENQDSVALSNLCFTANTTRSQFRNRLAIVADSPQQLCDRLLSYINQKTDRSIVSAKVNARKRPKIAFVFADLDSHFTAISRHLYETQAVFRETIDRCHAILKPYVESEEFLFSTQASPYAQAILFTFEYALTQMWRSWGIQPTLMLGLGVGEYVAACVAEALTLDNALKLLIDRERFAQSSNGAIQRKAFEQATLDVNYAAPKLKILSSLQEPTDIATSIHWVKQLESVITPTQAIERLKAQAIDVVLEIGPHPVLSNETAIKTILSSVRRGENEWVSLLQSVATLYSLGETIDWKQVDSGYERRRISLPTYPFQRQSYWFERSATAPSPIQVTHELKDWILNDLEKSGEFSEAELQTLPKLLKALEQYSAPAKVSAPIDQPESAIVESESVFVAPQTDIEKQLATLWEKLLGVESIGIHDNFFEVGGKSRLLTQLVAEVEAHYNQPISVMSFLQAPTIAEQAILIEKNAGSAESALIPIQPNGSKVPLFAVHILGTGFSFYRPLSKFLGNDQPVYGLSLRLSESADEVPNDVEKLATFYVENIRSLQPEGPYHLAGVSFGGLVAFEIARQLKAQGQQVALLALLDSYAPPTVVPKAPFRSRLAGYKTRLTQLKPHDLTEKLQRRFWVRAFQYPVVETACRKFYDTIAQPFPDSLQEYSYVRMSYAATSTYTPQVYSGKIVMFMARDQFSKAADAVDSRLAWRSLTTEDLDIHEIPGDHLGMLSEPHVEVLAEKMRSYLE